MQNKIINVALIGYTNSGKSTLLNSLVDNEISIVNKKKNTTNEIVIGYKNLKNVQYIFYDTPGVLKNLKSKFNKNNSNISSLWQAINDSDIIFYIIDSNKDFNLINENLYQKIKEEKKEILIVLNKIDLLKKNKLLPIINKLHKKYQIDSIIPISAINKLQINILIKYLEKKACIGKWIYPKNKKIKINYKQISREVTRNSLLKFLNHEVPYNIQVLNLKWKKINKNEISIIQNIITKPKYKKIVIGKKGILIKKIREFSQKKLSAIFKKKIHLYLTINKNVS